MEKQPTQKYANVEVSRPFFYYNSFGDWKNVETFCLIEIKLASHPAQPDKILYARGSALCSYDDSHRTNKKTGRKIAEQRARKVVDWFNQANHKLETFYEIYNFKGRVVTGVHQFGNDRSYMGEQRMRLLEVSGLDGLERRIMGLDKKPKADETATAPDSIPALQLGLIKPGE